MPRHTHSPTAFWPLLLLLAALLLGGCMGSDDSGSADYAPPESGADRGNNTSAAPDSNADYAVHAEIALANHQVARARQLYNEWLSVYPNSGQAAVGAAITDLLLILDSQPATRLLTENFGARSGIDSTDIIYGPDSFLYWLSRGASWSDQGQYQGIYSLLGDKLPWTKHQLESASNFVENLLDPVNLLIPNLVALADVLQNIEDTLQIALDDPYFTRFFIPGELLHDSRLALTLTRSEIAFVQSATALARAAIHFVAAYQHDWSLEKAFGAWRTNPTEADNAPIFLPAFGPRDYSIRYLDQRLFREVARPEQLPLARQALARALQQLRQSIDYGRQSQNTYVLQWEKTDPLYLQNFSQLLTALEKALFQPTQLPFTSPAIQADFSHFFSGHKTLDPTIHWMIRVDNHDQPLPDDSTAEGHWIFNETALQNFFHNHTYTPSLEPDKIFPDLELESPYQHFLLPVLETYIEKIQDAYLLAR